MFKNASTYMVQKCMECRAGKEVGRREQESGITDPELEFMRRDKDRQNMALDSLGLPINLVDNIKFDPRF